MEFKNKVILIVSPQPWGKMRISKHHYASEFALLGNTVYFINPPQKFNSKRIIIDEVEKNLFVVTYSPFFSFKIRFHLRSLYDILFKIQISKILKQINKKIDIIISFETSLITDLSYFKADKKIYFPVDMLSGKHQTKLINSSDLIVSVSDFILETVKTYSKSKPVFFVNHGLSNVFLKNENKSTKTNSVLTKVCFIGNLFIKSLDRKTFTKIILDNKNVNFTFYGAYNFSDSNIGAFVTDEAKEFIDFLKLQTNVELKGVCEPQEIAESLYMYSAFLVLINNENDYNKGSNSHKIIEYLSSGKVVVSSHISSYKKNSLIEMVDEFTNEKYPELFNKVITNLDLYNSPDLQKKRIEFAHENTYRKQISRIEKFLNNNVL